MRTSSSFSKDLHMPLKALHPVSNPCPIYLFTLMLIN
jgi:hypothetical protein